MSQDQSPPPAHLPGETAQHQPPVAASPRRAGRIKGEWDPSAPLTPRGQASFIIEFLKVSGVFDALVADCLLVRTSSNAPTNRDLIGTLMLGMLACQRRYAHVTSLRGIVAPDRRSFWRTGTGTGAQR